MGDHETPKGGDLAGLLGSREGVRHLLQDRVSRTAARRQELDPELEAAYDSSLEHAEEFARQAVTLSLRERMRFKKALALLRKKNDVRVLTDAGMMVKGEGVYEALLLQSWRIRYDDPQGMCHLTRVAAEMCDTFDPSTYEAQWISDLQARAWGELANAYRVADRLREAEQAFGKAFSFFQQGSGDRPLLMRLLDFEASLLGTLREFDIALHRLTILSNMYRDAGDDHLAGRALVTKSLYTFYRGNTEEACQIIAEALKLIDEERDPSLVVVAALDQLLFFVDSGRWKDAKRVLFEKRPSFTDQGRIAMLKIRWIEGRIDYGTGAFESAEIAFREAQEGFAMAEMGFAGSLSGLELALTLMQRGFVNEAIEEGLEAAAMFLSLSIHRELQGTMILLQDAFLKRSTDVVSLETLMRYLRRKLVEFGFK